MDNNKKLRMLSTALQNGAVEWIYDQEREILIAFQADENIEKGSPVRTDYWIEKSEDDSDWIWCIDRWKDGDVITGAARLFQA